MSDESDQPRLGQHGGKRIKGQQADNVSLRQHGNSVVYIVSRLRRDGRDDLIEEIRAHRISAYGAAVLMGYAKRRQMAVHGQDRNQARRPAVVDVKSLIG